MILHSTPFSSNTTLTAADSSEQHAGKIPTSFNNEVSIVHAYSPLVTGDITVDVNTEVSSLDNLDTIHNTSLVATS